MNQQASDPSAPPIPDFTDPEVDLEYHESPLVGLLTTGFDDMSDAELEAHIARLRAINSSAVELKSEVTKGARIKRPTKKAAEIADVMKDLFN